ncbi:MAG: hypothetical protein WKG07_29250 [Hymenobacter sp.]
MLGWPSAPRLGDGGLDGAGPAAGLLLAAPSFTGWAGMRLLRRYLRQARPAPITEGSLFSPVPRARHRHLWRLPGRPATPNRGRKVAGGRTSRRPGGPVRTGSSAAEPAGQPKP